MDISSCHAYLCKSNPPNSQLGATEISTIHSPYNAMYSTSRSLNWYCYRGLTFIPPALYAFCWLVSEPWRFRPCVLEIITCADNRMSTRFESLDAGTFTRSQIRTSIFATIFGHQNACDVRSVCQIKGFVLPDEFPTPLLELRGHSSLMFPLLGQMTHQYCAKASDQFCPPWIPPGWLNPPPTRSTPPLGNSPNTLDPGIAQISLSPICSFSPITVNIPTNVSGLGMTTSFTPGGW